MNILGSTSGTPMRGGTSGRVVRNYTGTEIIFNQTFAAPGSLAAAATDTVDAALSGLTAGDATLKLYSSASDPTYTRSTTQWAHSFDLTCLSATEPQPGTLISPRHVIGANHYAPSGTLRFVKADNTVVTRTVTGYQQVGTTDIIVGLLDSDVPAGITFARMLPSNFRDYIPPLFHAIPVARANQSRELRVMDWQLSTGPYTGIRLSTSPLRYPFGATGVSGDSGNPILLLLGGLPVILTHHFGASVGPTYADNLDGIAEALTSLGGGYTSATTIDLSGFTTP